MHCRQTFQQYWKVFCLESWCLRTKSDGILFPGRALLLLLYPYIQDGNFSYAPLASSLILMVHMVLQYPPGINKGGGVFYILNRHVDQFDCHHTIMHNEGGDKNRSDNYQNNEIHQGTEIQRTDQ